MRTQKDTSGKQPSANRTIAPLPVTESGEVDAVKSFMTKNPQNTFAADTQDVEVGSLSAAEIREPVAADKTPEQLALDTAVTPPEAAASKDAAQAADAVQAAAATASDATAADAAAKTPEAKVTDDAAKAAEKVAADARDKAAAQVPTKPNYAPDEKVYLVDGSEPWTREQVVAGLQERATLQPKAAEADNFRKLFGEGLGPDYDYAKAEAAWKPILEILRAEPEKTKFIDAAVHADAEKLAYLQTCAEYYDSKAPEGAQSSATANRTAAPAANDPRLDEAMKFISKQKEQAGIDRAQNEWRSIFQRYPFMQQDAKALEGLKATANVLYELDRKAGKDDLDCRGLLDALEMNAAIYDAMAIAKKAAAPDTTQRQTEVDPHKGPEALLSSTGPAPAGASRPRPANYTGNPDEAVDAFVRDHPGR